MHGSGGSVSKWRLIKKHLENPADFLPLHELQQGPDVTISDYAESVKKHLEEETVVCGHSMGGLIALELMDHPLVKGVVLLSSHTELPVHPKILQQLASGTYPEGLLRAMFAEETGSELLEEERERLKSVSLKKTYKDFAACDSYKEGAAKLRGSQTPLLAVYGTGEKLLPQGAEGNLRGVYPAAAIKKIPAAGHDVMLEQPEKTAEAVNRFVKSVEK
ncbi:alpha/beta fold hydrolase [Alkalicoccus saliphilus]|uniref:alpha/beta fold hydrolase n=1 Tax=Alkalicoccus saliphilus TaxID=200989 RepID=UPI00135CD825|nr:alpha/beta hydrolase [Alkalicoccus saliphilus]